MQKEPMNEVKVLMHYGILGQKWGVRRTPEELGRNVRFRQSKMPIDEYARACDLWRKYPEAKKLSYSKNEILSSFTNNLSDDEKERCLVYNAYKNRHYTAINKGHETYKIIKETRIPGVFDDWLDEILSEVVGDDWRNYDDK